MKKISMGLYIIAIISFIASFLINYPKLKKIVSRFDPQVYFAMTCKQYDQDIIKEYAFDILEIINYFIFFESIDIEQFLNVKIIEGT